MKGKVIAPQAKASTSPPLRCHTAGSTTCMLLWLDLWGRTLGDLGALGSLDPPWKEEDIEEQYRTAATRTSPNNVFEDATIHLPRRSSQRKPFLKWAVLRFEALVMAPRVALPLALAALGLNPNSYPLDRIITSADSRSGGVSHHHSSSRHSSSVSAITRRDSQRSSIQKSSSWDLRASQEHSRHLPAEREPRQRRLELHHNKPTRSRSANHSASRIGHRGRDSNTVVVDAMYTWKLSEVAHWATATSAVCNTELDNGRSNSLEDIAGESGIDHASSTSNTSKRVDSRSNRSSIEDATMVTKGSFEPACCELVRVLQDHFGYSLSAPQRLSDVRRPVVFASHSPSTDNTATMAEIAPTNQPRLHKVLSALSAMGLPILILGGKVNSDSSSGISNGGVHDVMSSLASSMRFRNCFPM